MRPRRSPRSTPPLRSIGSTTPPSCRSSAWKRCSGSKAGWPARRATDWPSCNASCALTVNLSSRMPANVSPWNGLARRAPGAYKVRGGRLGKQGGYICRLEHLAAIDPVEVARAALREEGLSPTGWTLAMAIAPGRNVVRLGFERAGRELPATWYLAHHALAARLSREQGPAVHIYAL